MADRPSARPPEHPSSRGRARVDNTLDGVDRRIIKILQKDGRTPNTTIARELGVTETTIRKRIATLVDQNLINIVAVPTPKAVGLSMSAIIGISIDLSQLRAVAERLRQAPEVRYVGLSTGRFDIMIEAFFADQQHFLEFISNTVGGLPGVTGVETSIILDVVKFSYEWEIG